jgi:uncharacterized metal-binding protein
MSRCPETKGSRVCGEGRRYVERQLALAPKKAVIACEGACVKGEVARVAANLLAYRLERDSAVRICLGDAVTGDTGMARLVERAPEVIAVEGCPLRCGTEILKGRMPELRATVFDASTLYSYDRDACFEIMDMPRERIEAHAAAVAEHVRRAAFGSGAATASDGDDTKSPRGCCGEPWRRATY